MKFTKNRKNQSFCWIVYVIVASSVTISNLEPVKAVTFNISSSGAGLLSIPDFEVANPSDTVTVELKNSFATITYSVPDEDLPATINEVGTISLGSITSIEHNVTVFAANSDIFPRKAEFTGGMLTAVLGVGTHQAIPSMTITNRDNPAESFTWQVIDTFEIKVKNAPEPVSTLLCSGLALGFGGLLKREYSKKNKKSQEKTIG